VRFTIREGAELHAETIVLDAGQKRLLISGRGRFLCSPTGNCPYWIIRETPTGYEKEVELGVAQNVTMEKGSAGFPDVRVRQHGSAFESEVRLYQFDGSQYRLSKCIDENYLDPNDLDHTLDKPTVTEFQCRH